MSGAISKLKKLGYVTVASFDGRKRILHSCLEVSLEQPSKKEKSAHKKEEERILVETPSETTKEDIPFSEIVGYLNESAGTRYRASTPKTREHIRARWREGYTLDDFRHVIDVKVAEWSGTDFARFLRPETLFGTKFENYLNQQTSRKQGKGRLSDYNYGS